MPICRNAVDGARRQQWPKKRTINSRLVIARNMVIRLGNGCVDIQQVNVVAESGDLLCRTGNGHYDKTGTCSPATFADDPDLWRRAHLPLARTWTYVWVCNTAARRRQQQPLSETSFAIWRKNTTDAEKFRWNVVSPVRTRGLGLSSVTQTYSRANGNEFKLI